MSLRRPPPAHPPREDLRPWLPKVLKDKGLDMTDVSSLTYIVVDEIVGDSVALSLSPWPSCDPEGRLRFTIPDEPAEVGVDIEVLCGYLEASGHEISAHPKKVDEPASRFLRIGDVFGAQVSKDSPDEWTPPLERWLQKPVYDLTPEARLVAKLAFFGAVADQWQPEEVESLNLREGPSDAS